MCGIPGMYTEDFVPYDKEILKRKRIFLSMSSKFVSQQLQNGALDAGVLTVFENTVLGFLLNCS